MINNTSFFSKNEKKKYSIYLTENLKTLKLDDSFISKNFHTKKEWEIFLEKLLNCNTYHAKLEEQKKTLNIKLCNSYTICPICSSLKRFNIINKFLPYYNVILKLYKIQRLFLYEATATIPGTKDLSEDYENLRESWTSFVSMGRKRDKKKSSGEASKIIGSIMSIEATFNQNKWHVHAHLFLVCDQKLSFSVYDQEKLKELYKVYGFGNVPKETLKSIVLKKINKIPVSKLTEEWFKATSGKAYNFWVNGFQPGNEPKKKLEELLKYVTKISDLTKEKTFELWDALTYKKRVTTSGVFTKSGEKFFMSLLQEYYLLEEFLSSIDNTKMHYEYEDIVEIDFNFKENEYQEKKYDGVFDFNWYESINYHDHLRNRNKIIHDKKNRIKELNNNLKSNKIKENEYIEKKNEIIDNSKKEFKKSINRQKYKFMFKSDQA